MERAKMKLTMNIRKKEMFTLFGRYEAMDAVNTIDPFTPCLMNARAAHLAE